MHKDGAAVLAAAVDELAAGVGGIDLAPEGVNPNRPANDFVLNLTANYPVLTHAFTGAGKTTIRGPLTTPELPLNGVVLPNTLDFYANATVDPSGHGEAERYLGSTSVGTGASWIATFDVYLPATTSTGEYITATATDPAGNTSELSAAVLVGQPNQIVFAGDTSAATASLHLDRSSAPDGNTIAGDETSTIASEFVVVGVTELVVSTMRFRSFSRSALSMA